MHETMAEKPTALILGCGYLGLRVARRLRDQGYAVTTTTRSAARRDELVAEGFEAVRFELANAANDALLARPFERVVYAVAPGRGDPRLAFLDGAVTAARRLRTRCFVYVSTIGVYAQKDGGELDEESPAEPVEERPRWVRKAEQELLALSAAGTLPVVVIRLGGLYGPGRSPVEWFGRSEMRARLETRGPDTYMNWIHIDDAANAVVLAAQRGRTGEVYLGVDGSPVRRAEFFNCAAACGGGPPLEFRDASSDDTPDLGKRLSCEKALRELGFEPQFPSYREGLASLRRE
jgi:nucleoside-diphosphate-sugar epimerase